MTVKGSDEYKQRQREYMRAYLAANRDELNEKRRERRKGKDGPRIRALQMESHRRRRDAVLKKNKARYEANRQHAGDLMRKSKYGVSAERYAEMIESQNGCCAICGVDGSTLSRPLGVDHCHRTLVVRRLLCSPCNTAIGLFKEDAARMRVAIDYLSDGPSWNNYLTEAVHGGVQ